MSVLFVRTLLATYAIFDPNYIYKYIILLKIYTNNGTTCVDQFQGSVD